MSGKMGRPWVRMLGVVGESMRTLGSGDIKSEMPLEAQVQTAGGQVVKESGIQGGARATRCCQCKDYV